MAYFIPYILFIPLSLVLGLNLVAPLSVAAEKTFFPLGENAPKALKNEDDASRCRLPAPVLALSPELDPYRLDVFAQEWLAAHPAFLSKLPVTNQSGLADPDFSLPPDKQALDKKINRERAAWQHFIGEAVESCLPLKPQPIPLGLTEAELGRLEVVETIFDRTGAIIYGVRTPLFTLSRYQYQGAHGQFIQALLFKPNVVETQTSKISKRHKLLPGVVTMHQATTVCGPKEPAGVCGVEALAFAKQLAEKGYVTLAPTSVGYDTRMMAGVANDGYEYHHARELLSYFPNGTLLGLRMADAKRAVAFLRSLPEVDQDRIGFIGHSNGGLETLLAAAFDENVLCAVANPGTVPLRWETMDFGSQLPPGIGRFVSYLPLLAHYKDDPKALPIDFPQLAAISAQRLAEKKAKTGLTGLVFYGFIPDDTLAPIKDPLTHYPQLVAWEKEVFNRYGITFGAHIVSSEQTPECRLQWGAPACLAGLYARCHDGEPCRAALDRVGMTKECAFINDHYGNCARQLWVDCLTGDPANYTACVEKFAPAGVTESCIQAAYDLSCRNNHAFHAETRAEALPLLEACLNQSKK